MRSAKNRVFVIPEASYDERTEQMAALYQIVKGLISMTRCTGEQAMQGKGVKRSFKWLLKRCTDMDVLADKILSAADIPQKYVQSRDTDYLEAKKAKEIFVDGVLNSNDDPDEDFEDEDDDYGDVYDAGFCYDDEDSEDDELPYMDLERMSEELYALKEDATDCVVGASDVIKSADELMEALEEIKYRLNY